MANNFRGSASFHFSEINRNDFHLGSEVECCRWLFLPKRIWSYQAVGCGIRIQLLLSCLDDSFLQPQVWLSVHGAEFRWSIWYLRSQLWSQWWSWVWLGNPVTGNSRFFRATTTWTRREGQSQDVPAGLIWIKIAKPSSWYRLSQSLLPTHLAIFFRPWVSFSLMAASDSWLYFLYNSVNWFLNSKHGQFYCPLSYCVQLVLGNGIINVTRGATTLHFPSIWEIAKKNGHDRINSSYLSCHSTK